MALEQVETMPSVARNFDPVSDTQAVIELCHSMSKIVFRMHEKSRDNGTEKGNNVGSFVKVLGLECMSTHDLNASFDALD